MKLLRSMTLATSVAALFAAAPLYAVGDSAADQRAQSTPQQLGGPGAATGIQSNQGLSGDASSRAGSADTYGGQSSGSAGASGSVSGAADGEGMSGSTGSQGQVDPVWTRSNEAPQSGDPISGSTGASGTASGSEASGSTDSRSEGSPLNSPAEESLRTPGSSSSGR